MMPVLFFSLIRFFIRARSARACKGGQGTKWSRERMLISPRFDAIFDECFSSMRAKCG